MFKINVICHLEINQDHEPNDDLKLSSESLNLNGLCCEEIVPSTRPNLIGYEYDKLNSVLIKVY